MESRGFTVLLVNRRHVKNVSARNSGMLDCQWPKQRMTYSLLSGTFVPQKQVCVLRAVWRQRQMLLRNQLFYPVRLDEILIVSVIDLRRDPENLLHRSANRTDTFNLCCNDIPTFQIDRGFPGVAHTFGGSRGDDVTGFERLY